MMKAVETGALMRFLKSIPIVLIVLLCTALSSTASSRELSWRPFVSEEGRFSVLMPGSPTSSTTTVPTEVGNVGQHLYSCECEPLTIDAEYSVLPALAALFGGRSRIYRNIVEEFVKREHAKEVGFESMTLDAYHGRVLSYETPTRVGKVFMLLISRNVYVLNASAPRDYPDKSFIEHFFKSFRPIYRDIAGSRKNGTSS
jgi:hypothetical protein